MSPKVRFFSIAAIALCGCASTEDMNKMLDPAVGLEVEKQLSAISRPPTSKVVLRANIEYRRKPTDKAFTPFSTVFRTSGDGIQIEETPGLYGTSIVKSTCGVFITSREVHGAIGGGNVTLPVGGVAMQVPQAQADYVTRYIATSIAHNMKHCAPELGGLIEATVSAKSQRRMSGAFSFNRFYDLNSSTKCEIDKHELDAAEINPKLRGKYIKVACSYGDLPDVHPQVIEFAFLKDLAIYIPLFSRIGSSGSAYLLYKSVDITVY